MVGCLSFCLFCPSVSLHTLCWPTRPRDPVSEKIMELMQSREWGLMVLDVRLSLSLCLSVSVCLSVRLYQHLLNVGAHDQEILGGRESYGVDAESEVGTHCATW